MKQAWINKGYISTVTTTIIGVIYAFLGFVGMLVPLDEVIPNSLQIWIRILISLACLLLLWLVTFIIVSIYLSRKKRFSVVRSNSGHTVYLQYGDLFGDNEVINPNERRNIIIPVNRCFDTIVDNVLVSERTLHGIALQKLYKSGKYTQNSLNQLIQRLLQNEEFEEIAKNDKPKGNRNRFPVGTVVDIPGYGNEHYLLWALSSFDNKLKAHTTMQEYALAVQKLIEACNTESEGFPVLVPLVGTGLSRTKKDQVDVLSYIINGFKINRDEINCDIHIIVRDDIKKEVSIMNIK